MHFRQVRGGGPGEGPRLVFEHAWLGIPSVFSWLLLPGRGAKAIQNMVFYGLLGHFGRAPRGVNFHAKLVRVLVAVLVPLSFK